MHKAIIQEPEIIDFLKSHYAIEPQSVQLLEMGADMHSCVYRVNAKDASYFVKLKFDGFSETNISIVQLIQDAGLDELIYPIAARDGALFKTSDHFVMLVYPFVQNQNGFDRPLTRNQWIQLGEALKKIHSLVIPPSLKQHINKEAFLNKWRESLIELFPQINSNSRDDSIIKEFKKYFTEHFNAIERLVISSERFSKVIQPDEDKFVLCHSDIHGGNVLLSTQQSLYIIDWDEPLMAPKERDLMFIGGGVNNVWNIPYEVTYFYEGYGESLIDEHMLAYYRHERIIEDIVIYSQDILSSSQDRQSKLISFNYLKSLFEPNGVVDIALSTCSL